MRVTGKRAAQVVVGVIAFAILVALLANIRSRFVLFFSYFAGGAYLLVGAGLLFKRLRCQTSQSARVQPPAPRGASWLPQETAAVLTCYGDFLAGLEKRGDNRIVHSEDILPLPRHLIESALSDALARAPNPEAIALLEGSKAMLAAFAPSNALPGNLAEDLAYLRAKWKSDPAGQLLLAKLSVADRSGASAA